jgi:hypothetical protein
MIDALAGYCAGQMVAIRVTGGLTPSFRVCVPQEIANGQLIRVVIRYIEARPKRSRAGAARSEACGPT